MELNKENLYREYIINNKTQQECMEIFNLGYYELRKKISEYHISKVSDEDYYNLKYQKKINKYWGEDYVLVRIKDRNKSQVVVKHKVCGTEFSTRVGSISDRVGCLICYKESKKVASYEELKKMYCDDNLNCVEIANKLKCHKSNIYRLIRKYNLKKTEEQIKECEDRRIKKSSTTNKRLYFDEDEIISYLKNGISEKEIADMKCCSKARVNDFVNEHNLSKYKNVKLRNKNQRQKTILTCLKKYGATNPMYNNEIVKRSYENRKEFNISQPEIALRQYVESIYNGEVTRYRDNEYELDIYIPDKKVGIEYNGSYWHSTLHKSKTYHYDKSAHFDKKGIRVIHIWEYEWENARQKPILENIIKNALGINGQRIYARKCKIEIRESRTMKDFFNQNNIQGFRGGKFAICLVYNNEVVMAYMMGHCFFGKGKYEWEVIRGATKLGVTVVGGASKIWTYFLETYKPNNCVYYIDFNYFNGNSLPYLGLTYIKMQPGFKNYWVKTEEVKNREPFRHKEIKELEKQGLVIPIYNAGTKVYAWGKSQN